MSVLSCYIRDFLLALAIRQGHDTTQPLALTVEDGRVLVASAPARASGVIGGMPLRQALARCPDLVTRELDMRSCQAEHAALLSTLAQTGLPVEATNWGSAYVDLREVTRDLPDAQSLIADLGRQVRHALGDALQPALGWDTGKFTARAASLRSKPGQMRLVSQPDETRFLTPLPVTLLPLPPITLQQLDWLGIHTLGTFARLPVAAVQQRFGVQGKLAQQLAQGRDDRPVAQTINAKPEPIDIDLEAPTTSQDVVLGAAMHALEPHLQALAQRLEGCRQLRAELRFIDGSRRTFTHIFVEPVCASAFIREMLSQELQRLTWPGELVALQLMLLDVSELTPTQLSLFPELDQRAAKRAPFAELVSKLAPRYGAIFWRAQMSDGQHPLPERRFCFLQEGGHHDAPVARQRNH